MDIARAGESLNALGWDKQDEIRNQTRAVDWSAQVVDKANINHLDPVAVQKARESFARKYANRFPEDEIKSWDTKTFLNRARLTQDGHITNTTLLLLGKPESAHLLSPHPAQMVWKLEGTERAYEHFYPPFLLSTTFLYHKIRNIQIRILPDDELLPIEVAKYDQKVVLEALHNCIAHQDYTRNGRIIVTEFQDKLVFENEGSFFEGSPDDYIFGSKISRRYRNTFLVQAMAELNMIDTMGYGIHEMHLVQAKRFLPLPDYDLSECNSVRMTIHGKVVDPAYSRLLMQKKDISLVDTIALDRVQKKLSLPSKTTQHLRRAGLIEGRKPNVHISSIVAQVIDKKAEYIKLRALNDQHYAELIVGYLEKFNKASREDINSFLWDKLSDALDDTQKRNKISNLLTNLRRKGLIRNTASRKAPYWALSE